MFSKLNPTARLMAALVLTLTVPQQLMAAGPAPVNLRSAVNFTILSGAGITTTGGGTIIGNIGASPISGSAIGVTCAQVTGTIYTVDAAGPLPCRVIDSVLLSTAQGDLTTAYNDAAGRVPVPSGLNLNPGLTPGAGNIGGMNLAPGLYKFTTTALITGADVTLTGGAEDVWIFQCDQDLQLGSGIKVILAGGAQAKNIFWQVTTSAVLGTSSVFKGTILADQAITMQTSSTMEGRALARIAGVVFNGSGAVLSVAPEIGVEQPPGQNLVDAVSSKDFGMVLVGASTSFIFTITNSGDANLTGLGITIDGVNSNQFSVTVMPVAPVAPAGSTAFTVRFAPTNNFTNFAVLHIASNDSDENTFDIALTGTGVAAAAPEIAVQQPAGVNLVAGVSTNDFGVVVVGASRSRSFTITNSGLANLTITLPVATVGGDFLMFAVTAQPTTPVPTNAITTFTVLFTPTTPGTNSTTLRILNNDSDEGTFDIFLTGVGTAVAAPEIAVQQPLGSNVVAGVSSRNFDLTFVGANSSLTFTITNSGTTNLTITLPVTAFGGDSALFSVTTQPTNSVLPGSNTTLTVRFTPTNTVAKSTTLRILNNDADEGTFDITLNGTGSAVPVPEIGVEQPPGTDLVHNFSTNDFGVVVAGASSSLTFTITNSGTTNLTGLVVTNSGLDRALFSVTTQPTNSVAPGSNTTFTVRFSPLSTGVKTAALHITSNDGDENPFNISIIGTGTAGAISASPNVFVISFSAIILNPQTGLFEQTVRLTNSSASPVPVIRLLIQALPADVQVYNASGNLNGIPFVQHGFSLAAGGTVDFLIEYYRASRLAIPQPAFVAEEAAYILGTATGSILEIAPQRAPMQAGRFFIEFTTTPGRRYAVEYSSDMTNWRAANPILTAPADRVQWYDDGPPKTETKPAGLGSRFYRVILLP